jgi:hypothetical protein
MSGGAACQAPPSLYTWAGGDEDRARMIGTKSGAPPKAELLRSAPFLAAALASAVAAFVGLGAGSYWMDELFSLWVVDHHAGFGEVLARALTDTHPPIYYFLLYPWIQAFGSAEAATRLLSAIFAVASLPVLFFGLRGALGFTARSFAVGLAATSHLFLVANATMRSYSLTVLVSAILLALALRLQRRLRADEGGLPVLGWAALWLASLFAEYLHFYSFLVVGMVHLYLLLQARRWRDRMVVVVSGATLLGLMSVYVLALLHSTRQDLGHMWFSNGWAELGRQAWGGVSEAWSGLGMVAVLALALSPWAERLRASEAPATAAAPAAARPVMALSSLVILGVVASGIAVSFLIAPSFGTRNLYVLGPFFWALAGFLFESARPGRWLHVALALLVLTACLQLRGRTAPQWEEWRASAAVVAAEPGCAGQPIPVVLPFIFGPHNRFFRDLAEDHFFGRYFPQPERLHAYIPDEFATATADPQLRQLLRARATGGCPVLAWGVHDVDGWTALKLQRDIAETAGLPSQRVRIREIKNQTVGMFGDRHAKSRAFIFERADSPRP